MEDAMRVLRPSRVRLKLLLSLAIVTEIHAQESTRDRGQNDTGQLTLQRQHNRANIRGVKWRAKIGVSGPVIQFGGFW